MPAFQQGSRKPGGNRWGSRSASNNPYTGSPARAADQASTDFWGTGFAQSYSGQNPYAGIGAQAQGYRNQVMPRAGNAADLATGAYPGGAGGGAGGKWWTGGYPAAGDPRVGAHMDHIMGGQRALMDDYAKEAAARNLRGQRVAGGADPSAQLHSQAMDTAARGYADRYGQAMEYVKDADQARYNSWNDRANRAAGLAGQLYGYGLQSFQPQLQAAQGESARQDNILAMQRADYRDDINWNRGEPQRDQDAWRMRQERKEYGRAQRERQAEDDRMRTIAAGSYGSTGRRGDTWYNWHLQKMKNQAKRGGQR